MHLGYRNEEFLHGIRRNAIKPNSAFYGREGVAVSMLVFQYRILFTYKYVLGGFSAFLINTVDVPNKSLVFIVSLMFVYLFEMLGLPPVFIKFSIILMKYSDGRTDASGTLFILFCAHKIVLIIHLYEHFPSSLSFFFGLTII